MSERRTYAGTKVPVDKSQAEVRGLLAYHGAEGFAFGEDTGRDGLRYALVTFRHAEVQVRMRVALKPPDEEDVRRRQKRDHDSAESLMRRMLGEEEARVWRVLAWNLKARMVAVEEGLETVEEAFLAHVVNPETGRTVYEDLVETGEVRLPNGMAARLLGRGTT